MIRNRRIVSTWVVPLLALGLIATCTRIDFSSPLSPPGEIDMAPPLLFLLGIDSLLLPVDSSFTDPGATAYDNYDGNLSSEIVVTVDSSRTDTLLIHYQVEDAAGNMTTALRLVVFYVPIDSSRTPSLVLVGPDTVQMSFGDTLTEPGCMAYDSIDGDLTDSIQIEYPAHFPTRGVFEIIYSVTNSLGNTAETRRVVVIKDPVDIDTTDIDTTTIDTTAPPNTPPVARFTISSSSRTVPVDLQFDGSVSVDADGSIASWSWRVDGDPVGSDSVLIRTFSSAGTTLVSLTVTDDAGSSATIIDTLKFLDPVAINQPPTAAFSVAADTSIAFKMDFDASPSFDSDGTIASYKWLLDERRTPRTYAPLVSHTYPGHGTWQVSLIVTDDKGSSDTVVQEVAVPLPSRSEIIVVDDTSVSFAATGTWVSDSRPTCFGNSQHMSTDGSATATWKPTLAGGTYEVWTYWDQNASLSDSVIYTITHAAGTSVCTLSQRARGTYVFLGIWQFHAGSGGSVVVGPGEGIAADAVIWEQQGVGIYQGPTAKLLCGPPTGPAPLRLCADGSSSRLGNTGIAEYTLCFGDGATRLGPGTCHYYETSGTFTCRLVIRDSLGYLDTDSIEITVEQPPANNGALLVVGNDSQLSRVDSTWKQLMEEERLNVEVIEDFFVDHSDSHGKKLIVISGSVASTNIGAALRNVLCPTIVSEPWLFDDMGMTGDSKYNDYNKGLDTIIQVINGTHPLAGGFSEGPLVVHNARDEIGWGIPGSQAISIASLPGAPTGNHGIFAYDSGVTMPGLPAPGRRVGFFLFEPSTIHPNTRKLMTAAVGWALSP